MIRRKICIIVVAVAIIFLAALVYSKHMDNKYSLNQALDYYGFKSSEQHEALKDLALRADIISKDQPWNSLFPSHRSADQLAEDIFRFIKATQEKFTVRSGTQERWEMKPLSWMEEESKPILTNLKILGFVDEVKAQLVDADAICILGAARKRMAERIKYAEVLSSQNPGIKTIILLAGERYVTPGVDGTEDELKLLANKLHIADWRKLTETNLIQDLYDHSSLKDKMVAQYTIDTPAGALPRPTTQTTAVELASWLRSHQEIKSIIFISNQPYVLYQWAIISSIFKDKSVPVTFEVVGPATSATPQAMLEGLGSYIWARSADVISNLGIKINDYKIKESFKELYQQHPLIYQTLPESFR